MEALRSVSKRAVLAVRRRLSLVDARTDAGERTEGVPSRPEADASLPSRVSAFARAWRGALVEVALLLLIVGIILGMLNVDVLDVGFATEPLERLVRVARGGD